MLRRQERSSRVILVASFVVLAACGSSTNVDAGSTSEPTISESTGEDSATTTTETDQTADPTDAPTTTATTEPEATLMPNLIGFTESEAQASLLDLGLPSAEITLEESSGSPGIVIEQLPSAGSEAGGTVTLVVSQALAPLPDFVGGPIADVRSWTDERDIQLRIETELRTDVPDGEVITQLPAAGSDPGTEVLVTIAETPTVISLVDLGYTDRSNFDLDDLEMDGNLYPQTHYFSIRSNRSNDTGFVDFNLSRDWDTFSVTLGIDDRNVADATAVVEITLDGTLVSEQTVVFGETIDLEIDVTDVLRMRISAKAITGGSQIAIGLGDGLLLSSTSEDG